MFLQDISHPARVCRKAYDTGDIVVVGHLSRQ
jgi:hypothetical protein